jgi:hypothetical protein
MTALAATEPFLLRRLQRRRGTCFKDLWDRSAPLAIDRGATFTDPNLTQQPPSNHGKKKPAVTKRRCRQILHHI